jgi:hypothetical protein
MRAIFQLSKIPKNAHPVSGGAYASGHTGRA